MGTNDSRIGNHRSMTPPPDLQQTGNGAQCRVYMALADRCNPKGECWPSLARLSADTKLHRTSVCRALKWLENAGYVVRTQRRASEESWQTTSYLLPAQDRSKHAGRALVANTPLVVAKTLRGSSQNATGGSSQNATGGSSQNATQTLLSRTPPIEHTSAVDESDLKNALVPATPKPWDVAHAAAVEVSTNASSQRLAGFATEIVKVAKRSGADPVRLVKLAGAVMALHGVDLDTLTNPSRSALLARLDALLALTPTNQALKARWTELSGRRGWPNDIGQRLERLISQWHTLDPATVPLPATPLAPSASARQTLASKSLRGRIDDLVPTRELPVATAQILEV
jgi:hypothetical protein